MSDPTHEDISSSEPLSATEQFLEKNFKKLMILSAFVVIGLLAYGFVRYKKHEAAVAAAEQFTAAKTIEDCDLVITQHPGTAATGNARLLKSDLLWEENKKDSSTSVLREFLAEDKGHPLYAQGLLGLASKLESMGEAAEAKKLFQQVSTDFPDSAVAPLARIRLGDLLWSEGKEDEAAEVYENLARDFPDTNEPFFDQSQSRLEWLSAKLPTTEVEPPAEVKAAEAAKKAAELPVGLKPPQINVDGTLGATISPDGGAMSPPVSPTPAPAPAAAPPPAMPAAAATGTVTQDGIAVPAAVAKEAEAAKQKLTDEAKAKAADSKKAVEAPVKKAADEAKAKKSAAKDASKKATETATKAVEAAKPAAPAAPGQP